MDSSSDAGDRPWQFYHTAFTNAKAGMDGVDKEKVQRTVYEMSKGSKFFENEQRKEAFIQQKIENMRCRYAMLTEADISHFHMIADKKINELEASRVLSRTWLHVDMDAFYAAVETLENPSLKEKPLAVGSLSMISTANYKARKFGVRAAMPGFIARKLCPDLIFVPTDFKKYTHYSELTRKVFEKYDPYFMATSLDEAYLDITDVCRDRTITSEEIAEELRAAVYEETGLTCSAGVGPNRLLAKVCSDINKPNGQFVLPHDRVAVVTFISSLPIRKIGGIGKVTEHILRDVLGINTCEEMLQKSAYICALFSSCAADFFLSVGLGLGKTETPELRVRKSISTERTFPATEDEALILQRLVEIAENLSNDMAREGLTGRTLTLKVKTASFEVRSRAATLQKYICSKEDILTHASKLLKAELPISLRLIGLRMSQFCNGKFGQADPTQRTLKNFIKSGDASLKAPDSENSTCSAFSNNCRMDDRKISGSIYSSDASPTNGDACDFDESSDSDHLLVDNGRGDFPCSGSSEMNNRSEPSKCQEDAAERLRDGSSVPRTQANIIEGSEMMDTEASSISEQLKEGIDSNIDDICMMARIFDDKQQVLSNEDEQSIWINDYKCSVCGFELPPSFIEERQYHSDCHLAEKLQESLVQETSDIPQKHRITQEVQCTRGSSRKKPKTTPKDRQHLTIDLFFAKGKQNL
ncbi:DNA polymerase kappa isoform X2 [Aristolochia californica]|uniref:DNA polymerase kappa isoform X2 n=2 Tax=Aristolochia californica TaxID=171875 RepID=UPI0035DE566C